MPTRRALSSATARRIRRLPPQPSRVSSRFFDQSSGEQVFHRGAIVELNGDGKGARAELELAFWRARLIRKPHPVLLGSNQHRLVVARFSEQAARLARAEAVMVGIGPLVDDPCTMRPQRGEELLRPRNAGKADDWEHPKPTRVLERRHAGLEDRFGAGPNVDQRRRLVA